MLAEQWRCRPSEADEEPAIWVLRWRTFQEFRHAHRALAAAELDDDGL